MGRRVRLGAACWVLTAVFFAGQAVAQAAARGPYSLTGSYISDLGATRCGPFTAFCSPLHPVMNGVFIATGLLTLLGAIATRPAWPPRRLATLGLALLVLAGAGMAVVGLAPEDVDIRIHSVGAVLGIPGASTGILVLGVALWRAGGGIGALLALIAGIVGLTGFLLMQTRAAGVAIGAAERLTAYPSYVWMIGTGVLLLERERRRARPAPVSGRRQEGSVPETRLPPA